MTIQFYNHNRTLTVQIVGDIDHHTSNDLKDKIDTEFQRTNGKDIIFDFGQVSFMDSSGIGMIIGRYKNAQKQGGQVFATNVNAHSMRIMELSGLQKIINIVDSVEDALHTDTVRTHE